MNALKWFTDRCEIIEEFNRNNPRVESGSIFDPLFELPTEDFWYAMGIICEIVREQKTMAWDKIARFRDELIIRQEYKKREEKRWHRWQYRFLTEDKRPRGF